MNLSNTLFKTVTKKLKFNESSLQEDKVYIKNLFYKTETIKKISENNLILKPDDTNNKSDSSTIFYIISVSFSRANTFIHLSNVQGKTLIFFSAGQVNLSGKQKKNRRSAVTKLITLLNTKTAFLKKRPVAIHLKNVKSYQIYIINKLKKFYWIKIIKSFNQIPYNGCRKSKIRRKKFTRKFK